MLKLKTLVIIALAVAPLRVVLAQHDAINCGDDSNPNTLTNKYSPESHWDTIVPRENLMPFVSSQKRKRIKANSPNWIDSLRRLYLFDKILIEKTRSLYTTVDSLHNTEIRCDVRKSKERLSSIQTKAQEKVTDVESKINENLSLLSNNGGNAPVDVNLGNGSFDLPSSSLSLSDVDMGLLVPESPNGSLNIPSSDVILPQGQLPQPADLSLPQPPELKVPEIEGMDKISEIQSRAGELGEITGKVKGYQEDVANVAKGNPEKIEQLSKDLESKVAGMEEMTELQKYDDMMKRYHDPQVMKEEALNKAKETAVNHFIGHEEELKAALEKFSEIRSRIPDPDGIYDMLKKRANPLKSKSLVERFLPGVTLQFQKSNSIWVDINPHIAYKLSGRFNVGLGWNERIAYDTKANEFDGRNRMYGTRSFIHFKVRSGLWLKGDAELMNAWVPHSAVSADPGNRAWIWSYFGGLKKDFQLSKHIMANVQMLYSLFDPDNQSPYTNRFNIRMGFEFPMKKKVRE